MTQEIGIFVEAQRLNFHLLKYITTLETGGIILLPVLGIIVPDFSLPYNGFLVALIIFTAAILLNALSMVSFLKAIELAGTDLTRAQKQSDSAKSFRNLSLLAFGVLLFALGLLAIY